MAEPDWDSIAYRVRLGFWHEQENHIHDNGEPVDGLAGCKEIVVDENLLCVQSGEFSQLSAALERVRKRTPQLDAFVVYNGSIDGSDELSIDDSGEPVLRTSRHVYSGFLFDARSRVVVALDDDSHRLLGDSEDEGTVVFKGWLNDGSDFQLSGISS